MKAFHLAAQRAKLLLVEGGNAQPAIPEEDEPRPEMLCFRGQTLALVRHFFEISSQVGRVSSLLGREFFRSRVSHHAIPSFEDQAVFVRDVQLCLEQLTAERLDVLRLMGLYDYSCDEVSQMFQCSRTLVRMWFNEALDLLSEVFLSRGLLRENHPDRRQRQVMQRKQPFDGVAGMRKPPASVKALDAAPSQEPASNRGPGRQLPRLA